MDNRRFVEIRVVDTLSDKDFATMIKTLDSEFHCMNVTFRKVDKGLYIIEVGVDIKSAVDYANYVKHISKLLKNWLRKLSFRLI